MRSRIIAPEMPAVVATQPMTSRSWQSMANATRTISPFQQVNSRPSEHPAHIRARCDHLAFVLARWPTAGVPSQQQARLFHQPVDALCIDLIMAVGSTFALEEGSNPPIAVGRSLVGLDADLGEKFGISVAILRPALGPSVADAFDDVGSARPGVSVTALTGNRFEAQSSTARSVFEHVRSRSVRFTALTLEDLDLECLASELAFQLADPLLETARVGRRDHVVIGANRLVATLCHQSPPTEHQARGEPMASGNVADRHAWLHRLGDDGELLPGGKAAAPSDASDDFDPGKRVVSAGVQLKRGAVQ